MTRLEAAVAELIEALRETVREESPAVARAPERLLSIDEASATLGLGRTRLYAEIGEGRIRSIQVGRRRLVPASAIADYIAAKGGER